MEQTVDIIGYLHGDTDVPAVSRLISTWKTLRNLLCVYNRSVLVCENVYT